MFRENAVFIIGAGASWHYGYPTGETLVKRVIEKAEIASRFFEQSSTNGNANIPKLLLECTPNGHTGDRWRHLRNQCEKLKQGLRQVNPLVIDYYLGWNPSLQDIGRFFIAWVITECEHKSRKANINRQNAVDNGDDWCRFITHQIAIHCGESSDLLKNAVSFVTFNYDVSLEMALRRGLRHIQMFDESHVSKFLGGSRIVHIYGKVRDVTEGPQPTQVNWDIQNKLSSGPNHNFEFCVLLEAVYHASKTLRVIDPHDKGLDNTEIAIARRQIFDAKRVYILGYGFDEHNSERLNLRECLDYTSGKRIAFTNFGDINQINKRASTVFFGDPSKFPPNGHSIVAHAEKSTRNAYDALSLDFDIA